MPNWNLAGTLLAIAFFLLFVSLILSQIHVQNPFTGNETNVIGWIISAMTGG